MTLREIAALRGPLFLLATVLAVSAAVVVLTLRLVEKAEGEMRLQRTALQEARLRYQRSGDERETIVRYLGDYENLEREGVVGDERRINWIDGLRTANIQSELFGVDYQIGVQQQYAEAGSSAGGIELRHSEMKIRLPLLHEGDLLRFLEILGHQQVGLFTVNKCSLDRTSDTAGAPRYQPNLLAECELDWITLVEANRREKNI